MKKKTDNMDMSGVGKTIQRLRQAYNFSLGDLADQSGVSKSIISQIERNETNPTLGTIWRLSNALDASIEDVVGNNKEKAYVEHLSKNATPLIKSEDGLCSLRVIGSIATVEWVQWYEFLAEPGGVLEADGHQSGSTEHMTVISGTLTVEVMKTLKTVDVGETIRYRCDVVHNLYNRGEVPLRAIMVLVLKPIHFS